jgi:Insertion element 4 transposase N-terminal
MGSTPASGRLTDHLAIGVLTGLIHRDIVDDVIRECGKREKRSRLLPAHVVMYYVLALNLFFGEAYEEVMRQLVNGLRFLGNWRANWEVPSTSAISQARTRLALIIHGGCRLGPNSALVILTSVSDLVSVGGQAGAPGVARAGAGSTGRAGIGSETVGLQVWLKSVPVARGRPGSRLRVPSPMARCAGF